MILPVSLIRQNMSAFGSISTLIGIVTSAVLITSGCTPNSFDVNKLVILETPPAAAPAAEPNLEAMLGPIEVSTIRFSESESIITQLSKKLKATLDPSEAKKIANQITGMSEQEVIDSFLTRKLEFEFKNSVMRTRPIKGTLNLIEYRIQPVTASEIETLAEAVEVMETVVPTVQEADSSTGGWLSWFNTDKTEEVTVAEAAVSEKADAKPQAEIVSSLMPTETNRGFYSLVFGNMEKSVDATEWLESQVDTLVQARTANLDSDVRYWWKWWDTNVVYQFEGLCTGTGTCTDLYVLNTAYNKNGELGQTIKKYEVLQFLSDSPSIQLVAEVYQTTNIRLSMDEMKDLVDARSESLKDTIRVGQSKRFPPMIPTPVEAEDLEKQ